MKKILTVFAVITVFMIAAIPAFADMDSPSYSEYKAYIVNENGAPFYQMNYDDEIYDSVLEKTGMKVPEGEEITIRGEFLYNGKYYGSTTYKEEYGYISLSDVSAEKPDVNVENAYKLEEPETVVIINPDGVYLRSAPSMVSEIVSGKIDFGTVITYDTVNEEYFHSWAYITHNGESGWLYTVQYGFDNIYNCANILSEQSEEEYYKGKLLTIEDGIQLTKTPDENSEKISKKIPAGTELEYEWYFSFPKEIAAYVEYEGVKGWIRVGNELGDIVATNSEEEIYIYSSDEKVYLYDFPNGKKTDIYVHNREILNYDYCAYKVHPTDDGAFYEDWYRVTVNGKTGWLVIESEGDVLPGYVNNSSNAALYIFEDTPVYSKPDKASVTDRVIPCDSEIMLKKWFTIDEYDYETHEYTFRENWYFVEFNGITGWIYNEHENYDANESLCMRTGDYPWIVYADSAYIYETYSDSSEIITKISEITGLDVKYSHSGYFEGKNYLSTDFYYVESDGLKGWVKQDEVMGEETYKEKLRYNEENIFLSDEEFEVKFEEHLKELIPETTVAETEPATTAEQSNSVSPDTIIIGCIAGAFILGLTAVVIVILINKKKKSAE